MKAYAIEMELVLPPKCIIKQQECRQILSLTILSNKVADVEANAGSAYTSLIFAQSAIKHLTLTLMAPQLM
jgi:hypothetical protein